MQDGWTPLHNASMMGHTDMCKFLLSRGANPDALNADEQTPADVSEDEALKAYLQSLGVCKVPLTVACALTWFSLRSQCQ